jgi:hypothetical protein
MNISISAKAREYILGKGGVVHIVSNRGMSVC